MSPALKSVMRDSAKLSGSIAPLDQRCPCAGVGSVVVGGHTLAGRPGVHPSRDSRQRPSITRPTEVAYDSVAGSVSLEDGHVLTGKALRLTWCIRVHSVGIRSLEGS